MKKSVAMFLLLGVAGCTVGPAYKRPEAAGTAGTWINAQAPGPVAIRWWKKLDDATLDGLVEQALRTNLDIREAQARLKEARANRDVVAGRAVPEAWVSGSATEQVLSRNGQLPVTNIPNFASAFLLFDLGFDASWEVDLWGGTRRSIEASNARSASVAARIEDVRLQIAAETVRAYVDMRAAQVRVALLSEDQHVRAEIARLVTLRYRAGESARTDAEGAEQRASAAAALVPDAQAAVVAAAYRLALLTGQPPEALQPLIAERGNVPTPPTVVATGIRSELLQRRPDIAAAEADLQAANADVGVQTANLYPHFSLMGSIGQQARTLGDLASGDSTYLSIGPSFSWPIFNLGRTRAQIRAADARTEAAIARYEKAVLGALADSETAANRFARTNDAFDARGAALEHSATQAMLAEQRFNRGEDDRIQMLEARSARIAAALQERAAAAERLNAYVALSKALAGGIDPV